MTRVPASAAVELIREVYCQSLVGCCLHVQLDDGNLDDSFFTPEHREWLCATCLACFDVMARQSVTARRKACQIATGGGRRGD